MSKVIPLWVVIVVQIIAAILEHRSHDEDMKKMQGRIDTYGVRIEVAETRAEDAQRALVAAAGRREDGCRCNDTGCPCQTMTDAERAAVIEKEHLKRNGVIKLPSKPIGDAGALPKPPPLPKPDPNPRPWRDQP